MGACSTKLQSENEHLIIQTIAAETVSDTSEDNSIVEEPETSIDIKKEGGQYQWYKVQAKQYKSKNELLSDQICIDKLKSQSAIYVHYIDNPQDFCLSNNSDEWISFNTQWYDTDIKCTCNQKCIVDKHRISFPSSNDHLQSRLSFYARYCQAIVYGFIREHSMPIEQNIIDIIFSIYESLQFYNVTVGHTMDVKDFLDNTWHKTEVKYHKLPYDILPTDSYTGLSSLILPEGGLRVHVCKLMRLEGIYTTNDEWIFFTDNNIICDCKYQCIINEHIITGKYNRSNHLQTQISNEINTNHHKYVDSKIDIKNKNEEWFKVIIKQFKSKNQLIVEDFKFKSSQYQQIGIYVHYIGMKHEFDEWIFIKDMSKVTCDCDEECIVKNHRITKVNNHLQSTLKWNRFIITAFIRPINPILDMKCIIIINLINTIMSLYRSMQFYHGKIPGSVDIRSKNKWYKVEVGIHKLPQQGIKMPTEYSEFMNWSIPNDILETFEGIHVYQRSNGNAWFFFRDNETICDCKQQCKFTFAEYGSSDYNKHIITDTSCQGNKHLQTEIQLDIKIDNKIMLGAKFDLKDNFDIWHKVKIEKFKSKRELLRMDSLNESQIQNINVLQRQIGMYVQYIEENKDNEWIFFDKEMQELICECKQKCMSLEHFITKKGNHFQSTEQRYSKIVFGFFRLIFKGYDMFLPCDIKQIIITNYKSMNGYDCSIGDACDVCIDQSISQQWYTGIILYHKPMNEM
eukprot:535125_1